MYIKDATGTEAIIHTEQWTSDQAWG